MSEHTNDYPGVIYDLLELARIAKPTSDVATAAMNAVESINGLLNMNADLLAACEMDDAAVGASTKTSDYYGMLRRHGWDGKEQTGDFRDRFRRAAIARAKGVQGE